MADGDQTFRTPRLAQWTLIELAAGTGNGTWIDPDVYQEGSISVTITGVATVKVTGSDEVVQPASATHGNQIGNDITGSGMFDLQRTSRYIKARVTSFGSGTITVKATLRSPSGAGH